MLSVLRLIVFVFIVIVIGHWGAFTWASNYDPHKIPMYGVYFEGWSTRVVNTDGSSVGYMVGSFCSTEDRCSHGGNIPGYVAIMYQGPGENYPIITSEAYVKHSNITVRNGQRVTKDPDFSSEPDFLWTSELGLISHDSASLSVRDYRLELTMSEPEYWNPENPGEGPGGFTDLFPLPYHWFVYSLASEAEYAFIDVKSKKILSSGVGYAHQEKSWGYAFPSSWVWSEGMVEESSSLEFTDPSKFVLSGGSFSLGPIEVATWFVGYRSKKLQWDFKPQSLAMTLPEVDSCRGEFRITIVELNRKLIVRAMAPTSSFSDVSRPTRTGFTPNNSMLSYSAHVVVEAYISGVLVEKQIFQSSALEFGGEFKCDHKKLY